MRLFSLYSVTKLIILDVRRSSSFKMRVILLSLGLLIVSFHVGHGSFFRKVAGKASRAKLQSRAGESDDFDDNGDFNNGSDHETLKRQATDTFRLRALSLHNEYRSRHGSPPLTLDDNLNKEAQAYSEEEMRKNAQKHSCDPCNKYGENLAYSASTTAAPKDSAAAELACKQWYDEISLYNCKSPNLSSNYKWGHFTALVWKSSTKMGIGLAYGTKVSAKGNKMNTVYIVARYSPPGNVYTVEEMKRNVLPPK